MSPTSDYDSARAELLAAEVELTEARERVAEMRRQLPSQPTDDYQLTVTRAGSSEPAQPRRLSELFSDPDRTLVLMQFMLGEAQTSPCPMCSMWADGWNGIVGHLAQRINFAVAAAAPAEDRTRAAHARGWTDLRLVSAAPSTFKADIGGEDDEGNQWPFLSVYELVDGAPRLTYSGGAHITGEHWRGIDLLSPVWNFFDLTRDGRGDWMPAYEAAAQE